MSVATQEFSGTFVADPDHSSVQFAVKHMKVSSFRATFGDVEARLAGVDSQLSLEGRARVESVSISNPPEFREHVVNGEDFFDARNHPEIVFRSNDVSLGDDGIAKVDGDLEIKGITRPLVAPGTYQAPVEDPYGSVRTAIELNATIDRREWDMGWQMPLPKGGDVLGYEIELTPSRADQRGLEMLVLGISGSLRRASHNRALLAAAQRELPPELELDEWRGLATIPPYNEDIASTPAAVGAMRGALARADAVLIATPEYNHSIPGQLKNAIDWASRPFPDNALRGKPVAVIGASTGLFGAVWAQAELRKVLSAAGAVTIDGELPVGSAHEAFEADGSLRDPELRERLESITVQLLRAVGARAAAA